MSQADITLKLNWSLQAGIGAAWCYRLESYGKKPKTLQTAKPYPLKPDENMFKRINEQQEVSLYCLIQGLKVLQIPCIVTILASSNYLERTLYRMPTYAETDYFSENHRNVELLKELWTLMQTHELKYLLHSPDNKALDYLKQAAEAVILETPS